MSLSERKSFCIDSLLSRGSADSGGLRGVGGPPDLSYPHEVISPSHSPPHSPIPSPHSSPHSPHSPHSTSPAVSSAMLGGRGGLMTPHSPLIPPHLYQYPGMGMPPGLLPAHFPHASQFLDAHTLTALKTGGAGISPGALDWFTRAGLMYPRLPPELAG